MATERAELKQHRITIVFTWRLALYIIYLICLWYFLSKAIINTYTPSIAGMVWVAMVTSYVMSIYLIERRE